MHAKPKTWERHIRRHGCTNGHDTNTNKAVKIIDSISMPYMQKPSAVEAFFDRTGRQVKETQP